MSKTDRSEPAELAVGSPLDCVVSRPEPERDTYDAPLHGWTCFHCGETFTTVGSARTHFGATPDAEPGCTVRVQLGPERGLLMALRKAEEAAAKAWAAVHSESTDAHNAMHAMQSRHAQALADATELGYADGLRDARNSQAFDVAQFSRRINALEAELQRECDDGTELLRMLGLDPDVYCTDGGSLNLPKIRAALADSKPANAEVRRTQGPADSADH